MVGGGTPQHGVVGQVNGQKDKNGCLKKDGGEGRVLNSLSK